MITVMEIWRLRHDLEEGPLAIMQKMDDLLGPAAHEHPGWCGHARFLESEIRPGEVVMMYPWLTTELHRDLTAQEELLLKSFYEGYCLAPREIHYYTELMVDVEQGATS